MLMRGDSYNTDKSLSYNGEDKETSEKVLSVWLLLRCSLQPRFVASYHNRHTEIQSVVFEVRFAC